ncbi:MAG: phage portal protein [Reyranella sp.]
MRIPFTNFEIGRVKQAQDLAPVYDRGWFSLIREPFTGAWARGKELRQETIIANYAVFSCLTIIPSDIAKCRPCLKERDASGIWREVRVAAYSPVLSKPNKYQTIIQFIEAWVISKLIAGNTYVLLERDNRNVVVAMYVLDPLRCKPLVAPNGDIYYRLDRDNLTGIEQEITVPASEIIHDRWPVALHPLIGLPPLLACSRAASVSENIQIQSDSFFANGARPSGILVAPGNISKADADRLKEHWENKYKGEGYGGIAVMGNGLEYKAIVESAVNSQLVEQLGSAGKIVTTAFNIPAYMVGIGDPPSYNNIEALNQQYYSQCLQKLFESIEELLDIGLGLRAHAAHEYGVEFDLDNLLRMDTATRVKTLADGIKGAVLKPNEARANMNLPPVEGGDEVYLQQQNYSLAALAKRDAKDDPFASSTAAAADIVPPDAADNDNSPEALAATRTIAGWLARDMFFAA